MPINIAARIMDLGDAGQILMSRVLFDDARQYVRQHPAVDPNTDPVTLPPLTWMSHGFYEVKGQDQSLEVCEVGVESIAPLSAPEDSGKAKRIVASATKASAMVPSA